MSNLNELVGCVLSEELGYAGVEMHNDKYPASQDDGGTQTSPRKMGDPVLGQGTDQSSFHKDDSQAGSKMGDPNLSFVKGKDPRFDHNSSLKTGMMGKPVINFGATPGAKFPR